MNNEKTLTTKAGDLVNRATTVVQESTDRLNAAQTLPHEVLRTYSAEARDAMIQKQVAKATEENQRELDALQADFEKTLKDSAAKVRTSLRPLQTSKAQADRMEGISYEQKAHRVLASLGVPGISDEYQRAMDSGLTDYASELLEWGGIRAAGTPMSEKMIRDLKSQHIDALGLRSEVDSSAVLQDYLPRIESWKTAILAGLNPFLKPNITEGVLIAKGKAENPWLEATYTGLTKKAG